MKTKSFFLMMSLMLAVSVVQAQKALPVQGIKFLSGLTMPQDCSSSYSICTIQTDEGGLVSIKDAGKIDSLVAEVSGDLKELGMSMMNTQPSVTTSMPSQEQMAQMQQSTGNMQGMTPEQAMKMAQNMSHQTAVPQVPNANLMDEIGKAQPVAEELTRLVGELNSKAIQFAGEVQPKLDKVERTGTCPDVNVKGADLALPRCSCVKQIELSFCDRRMAVENSFLGELNSLLQSYMPRIKGQVAAIDKIESDLKYGDAINISAMKMQVVGVQQQELSAIQSVLGLFSQTVQKAGGEYAPVVNINTGHLPACQ